jgi:uncharacterized membrane protein (UPF0127 family)
VKITVVSSGAVVATDVRWASSFVDRTRGLLGEDRLEAGSALVFEPARQIHTFGMRFPLDVVFCDAAWKVLHVVRNMPPTRMTRPVMRSHFALELAGGSLSGDVRRGETLKLTP